MTEVTPPTGLDIAEPVLVPYLVTREASKCVQVLGGPQACVRVSDSVGYVLVVIVDSPSGEVVAVTNPPTSTAPRAERAPDGTPAVPALLALGGLGIVVLLLVRPRSRRRPTPS